MKPLTSRQKFRSFIIITCSSTAIFTGMNLYQGNEKFYKDIAMPLIRLIEPETAHNLAILALKWGFVPKKNFEDTKLLKTTVWGLNFDNPIGMAAGFDKQGEAIKGLKKTGFGFVEIGSVTPEPQPGNAKPRVFRLISDNGIINRYGFNSDGHEIVYNRIKELKEDSSFDGIIGINLGKNKNSKDSSKDYIDGIKKFSTIADYLVINISSPNTEGLRNLQNRKNLEDLLIKINEARKSLKRQPPLLLKLSPDLTNDERQDIADVVMKKNCRIDGLILSNTTITRNHLKDLNKYEIGGLSGAPINDLSTEIISDMYKKTNGKIPIIGAGGIFSGKDAYDKIKAGASLIQIYTSYALEGPPVVSKINKELNELIKNNGHHSIAEAVGKKS